MFFILSKLLIYFLFPFSWIVVLLICTCFIKNKIYQRRAFITALAILLVFSNSFLLKRFSRFWDFEPNPVKTTVPYSCALVLGGYISEDEAHNGYFNGAADRFIQAVELKETGKVTNLLFTGGDASLHPDGFTEANWLRLQLKAFHLPDSTLLFEKKSRNTIENISYSKPILEAKHLPPPYLLVTSAFHMRRALLICKKANLDVVPYPCNFSGGKGKITFGDFIPSSDALQDWNTCLKELVGYGVTYLKS